MRLHCSTYIEEGYDLSPCTRSTFKSLYSDWATTAFISAFLSALDEESLDVHSDWATTVFYLQALSRHDESIDVH